MSCLSTQIFLLVTVGSLSSLGCSFLFNIEGGEEELDAGAVEETLVVQYFIDEDSADEMLRDQSNNQFDLPLEFSDGNQARYCEVGENQRGLCWDRSALSTRATRDVAGTGVATALNGTTVATLEFVVALDDCDENGSRIVQLGPANTMFQGGLTLLCQQVGQLAFAFGTSAKVVTDELIDFGSLVIHAVVDTRLATPRDRLRIYVNGVHVDVRGQDCGIGTLCGFAPPGAALNLDGYILTMGNRFDGNRSVSGSLRYGAIYNRALASSDVLARSDVLAVSDDQ